MPTLFWGGKNYYCVVLLEVLEVLCQMFSINTFFPPSLNHQYVNRNEMLISELRCYLKLVTKCNLNPVSSCALGKLLTLSVVFSPTYLKDGIKSSLGCPSAVVLNCSKMMVPLWKMPCHVWVDLFDRVSSSVLPEQRWQMSWVSTVFYWKWLTWDGASRDIEYFSESLWISLDFIFFK